MRTWRSLGGESLALSSRAVPSCLRPGPARPDGDGLPRAAGITGYKPGSSGRQMNYLAVLTLPPQTHPLREAPHAGINVRPRNTQWWSSDSHQLLCVPVSDRMALVVVEVGLDQEVRHIVTHEVRKIFGVDDPIGPYFSEHVPHLILGVHA